MSSSQKRVLFSILYWGHWIFCYTLWSFGRIIASVYARGRRMTVSFDRIAAGIIIGVSVLGLVLGWYIGGIFFL